MRAMRSKKREIRAVLVVADDVDVASAMTDVLRQGKYQVEVAGSIEEALQKLDVLLRPGLVLFALRREDGRTFITRMKQHPQADGFEVLDLAAHAARSRRLQ